MMADWTFQLQGFAICFTLLALLGKCPQSTNAEKVLGEETEDFDFDGLPGVQHEFRVEIKAAREECFYQKIRKSANLHVSFEVVRGADRNVDMVVKRPDGTILESHLWTHEGTTEKEVEDEGIYSFCIDNSMSRFSAKLVHFYLVIFHMDEWSQYSKDVEELDLQIGNFTEKFQTIDQNVGQLLKFQATGRRHAIADWYLLNGMNNRVRNGSIFMCAVILVTSGIQVYFVRKLFSSSHVKGNKPRA